MRTLPAFGKARMREFEKAWAQEHDWRARKRLQVIRLVAQHQLKAGQIAEAAGVGRRSVFRYIEQFKQGGIKALLAAHYSGEGRGSVKPRDQKELVEQLRQGSFKRAKDAQAWLAKRAIKLALSSVYYWLGKAGGVLKVPRKTHAKKDAAKARAFREGLGARLLELAGEHKRVRVWVVDEHRYGLLPVIRRCWGLRGVRVHAPYATRYQWGYLYEALEVDGQSRSEFLFMPTVSKDISNLFLRQLSEVEPEALHIVIWDGAGFHAKDAERGVPENVRLVALPAYSPELNPVEGLGDRIKDAVSNRLFKTLRGLEDAILEEIEQIRAGGEAVSGMIHGWMRLQANNSDPI
jgi:transposase